MQSLTPIELVYSFNEKAGLLNRGYDPFLETSMNIEESLEALGVPDARELSRSAIVEQLERDDLLKVKKVDSLDAHLDSIVINLGSIFKLGLTVEQTMHALFIVASANLSKLSAGKDEFGKQMKPENFVGPESDLQNLLDSI
ncbi:MAG: hypothetical protein ACTSVR_04385 [Candidatus Thorarchaeota archaeon]